MGKAAYAAGACVLILLGALTPAASPIPSGSPVAFVTVAKGTTSRVHETIQVAIHDPERWGRLWMRIMAPGRLPPAVDFGRDMIIALSSDPRPEPAVLTITRITRDPDRLVVWYTLRETRPLPEGGGTGMSAPFHIVRLARSLLPVEFVFLKTPPILQQLSHRGSAVRNGQDFACAPTSGEGNAPLSFTTVRKSKTSRESTFSFLAA